MDEERIFIEALQRPTTERTAFLDSACGSDTTLRRDVEALLFAHEQPDRFVLQGAARISGIEVLTHATEAVGGVIGPYRLLEQIGEGGMGVVYVAEQSRPVRRKVAVKVLKPGMDSRQVVARFEAERQALALMDHPNIARVLDASTTDVGRPYFVMELVKGAPITEYCEQLKLGTQERLQLFIDVCHAVQHAHQKGIIHRDLKPSNVLVSQIDGKPVAKIIDFGIAKATGQQLTDKTLYTGFAQLIGTPLYMSPEQAALSGVDVDTRSDVYSLGVMLYELLTGTTPFSRETLSQAGYDELRRIIREDEPPRPSTRVSTLNAAAGATVAASQQVTVQYLSRQLRHELDWIVMKALEKDRNRRYESASALAADIERYLKQEPVQACPPSPLYQARKLASKHRTAIFTASLFIASLVLGLILTTLQSIRATAAEERANSNASEAAASEAKAKAAEQKALATAASEAAMRKQAEQNFESALDAVDRMMANAVDPELNTVERIGPLRRKMLRDAIAFYDRIPLDQSLSVDVRRRLADTWDRLAWNCRTVDDNDQARQAYEKAIRIMQEVASDAGSGPDDSARLAGFKQSMGWFFLHSTHEPALAENAFRESVDLYAETHKRDPDDPAHQRQRAHSRKGLGMAFAQLNQHERAIAELSRAVELFETCETSTGGDLGDAVHELAKLTLLSAPVQADDLYFRAVRVYRDFLKHEDDSDHNRSQFATILNSTAQAVSPRHPDEAQKLWDESVECWQAINGDSPRERSLGAQHIEALRLQATHLRNLARDASAPTVKASRLAKANALYQECIERNRRLVSSFAIPEDRDSLCSVLREQAIDLLEESADDRSNATAKRSQADALLTEAIQIRRALAAEFPTDADFRARLTEIEELQSKHFSTNVCDSSCEMADSLLP